MQYVPLSSQPSGPDPPDHCAYADVRILLGRSETGGCCLQRPIFRAATASDRPVAAPAGALGEREKAGVHVGQRSGNVGQNMGQPGVRTWFFVSSCVLRTIGKKALYCSLLQAVNGR